MNSYNVWFVFGIASCIILAASAKADILAGDSVLECLDDQVERIKDRANRTEARQAVIQVFGDCVSDDFSEGKCPESCGLLFNGTIVTNECQGIIAADPEYGPIFQRVQKFCDIGPVNGSVETPSSTRGPKEPDTGLECIFESAYEEEPDQRESAFNDIKKDLISCPDTSEDSCSTSCRRLLGGPLISDQCKISIANAENGDLASDFSRIMSVCGIDLPTRSSPTPETYPPSITESPGLVDPNGRRTPPLVDPSITSTSQAARAGSQISTINLALGIGGVVIPIVLGFIGFG